MWAVCVRAHAEVNQVLFSQRKKDIPAICDNMDQPWGHYDKWKANREVKYYMISLILEYKKAKPIETENRMVVTSGWRKRGVLVKEYKRPVWDD